MENINIWLNEAPKENEIALNPMGNPYVPIDVVKRLLGKYCLMLSNAHGGTYTWQDCSFIYNFVEINGVLHICGSIQLQIVNIKTGIPLHSFSGGSNVSISSLASSNIDQFVGTVNSMALTNAARKIGNRFGGGLYEKMANVAYEHGLPITQIKDKEPIIGTEQEKSNLIEAIKVANYKLAKVLVEASKFSLDKNVLDELEKRKNK